MGSYDIIVVGGGTAGLVTAAGSAGIGAKVALVERERLGGECLWNGCVPSKALIATARAAHDSRASARFGVRNDDPQVDFGRAMQWIRDAQARIAPNDSPERFRELGVDVIEGEARFTGERTLDVDGRTMTGRHIVIATGSAPDVPPIDGLADVPYHTNETIFSLVQQPATLLVLGGGAIGLELAQAFSRLGTTVHVLEAEPQLLPREDREIATLLGERLAAEGVHLHLGARVTRVDRAGRTGEPADGRDSGTRVRVTVSRGRVGDVKEAVAVEAGSRNSFTLEGGNQDTFTLEGDALLVATGRRSRLDSLELARGNVDFGTDGVTVDGSLRTTANGVWAAGDCVGPLRFTHVADYQARLVVRNAFFPLRGKADYSAVPWVTFTEPELAHVGLTEEEARQAHGDDVRVWRRPFAEVDRAITDGETDGLVKLVTTSRGRILGGHILGHGAGNMIGEITLAMKHGISATALGNTIHPYPTYPDAIRHAAESFTRSRFTGVVKRAVNWYLGAQRAVLLAVLLPLATLAACSSGSGTGSGGAGQATVDSLAPLPWDSVVARARGTEVVWRMWRGDPSINAFVDDWVAPRVRERYGIALRAVEGQGPEIVNQLVVEREASGRAGTASLLWINGETFSNLRREQLLAGPWSGRLPSAAYVDSASPIVARDFEQDPAGYESPWGRVQFALIYDSLRTPVPPRSFDDLAAWIRAHPGRFTHDQGFTGITFLKMLLYDRAGGVEELQGGFDSTRYEAARTAVFAWVDSLRPFFWRDGATFPPDVAAMHRLFANREIDFSMSNNQNEVVTKVRQGILPPTSRALLLREGTIANTHFLGIPANAPNAAGAMVVADFLLSPEAQLEKQRPEVWADGTVLDVGRLPDEWRSRFITLEADSRQLPRDSLARYARPEVSPRYHERLAADWRRHVRAGAR